MAKTKQPKPVIPDGYFIERYSGSRTYYWSIYQRVNGNLRLVVNSTHADSREDSDEMWFDLQNAIIEDKITETSMWSIHFNDDSDSSSRFANPKAPYSFSVFGASAGKYRLIITSAKFSDMNMVRKLWEEFKQMVIDCNFEDEENR